MSFLFTPNGDTVTANTVLDLTDESKKAEIALSGSGRVLVQNLSAATVFVAATDIEDAGTPVMPYSSILIPYAATLHLFSPYCNAFVYFTPGTNA